MKHNTKRYKVFVEVDVDALNKEEAEEIVHEFVIDPDYVDDYPRFAVQYIRALSTVEVTREDG